MSYMDVMGGGPMSFSADAARVAAQNNSFNQSMANAAAQNNAALAAGNAYNPWANTPGGFGAQTAAYSGIGAGYGRATGGFNAKPQAPQAPQPGADQGIADWGSQPMVDSSQLDRLKALYPNAFKSGGGIGSDAARAPSQPAIEQSVAPPYQPPVSFDQRWSGGSSLPPMITAGQPPAQTPPSQSTPQTEYPPFNAGGGGGGQADRLRALYPDAFKTGSPYGKLFPGPASPTPPVTRGPDPLPATPNWTDAQRAQGTDQARNAFADQLFRNGTAPVKGETGWVNLPQSWYNQTGTPNAKQMFDPLQGGGGFSGNQSIGGSWDPFFGGNSSAGG